MAIETIGRRTIWSAAFIAAAALPASAADEPPLRVGVAHVTPALGSAEFRVFTEDGYDGEIARQIGKAIGREVEFVRVAHGESPGLLRAGAIDLAVERVPTDGAAPSGDALPTGYESAKTVAMRTDTAIREWSDLRGRTVCVSEADGDGRRIAADLGAVLHVERAPALSLMRVRTGECDAALHDETVLAALFDNSDWHKFSATLPPVQPSELVVAVSPGDDALRARIGSALKALSDDAAWKARHARWARNVSFEVYLEQDAPDCH